MTDGSHCPDGFVDSVSLLQKSPTQWSDCVSLARVKFEMYFNHKVCSQDFSLSPNNDKKSNICLM